MYTLYRTWHADSILVLMWTLRVLCAVAIGLSLVELPAGSQEGTASLSGMVRDVNGRGIAQTRAELRSETSPEKAFVSKADDSGEYRLARLPAGEYTLKLSSSGFEQLTVRSIQISDGEQKQAPALDLLVSNITCDGQPRPEYLRFLTPDSLVGNLGGSVRLARGPTVGNSPPVAGADVTLLCGGVSACGTTRTDLKGEFVFRALSPGLLAIRVSHAGFYRLEERGYHVKAGLESVYWSVFIERCALGDCNPSRRPAKPVAICE